MTSVSVGNGTGAYTLAEYLYGTGNGNLATMTYGNGDTVSYTYDVLDRVTEEYHNGTLAYTFAYNAEGYLCEKLDIVSGSTVNYEYDSLGRLIRSSQTEPSAEGGRNYIQRTEHVYDGENRISAQSWTLGTTNYNESYSYNTADGSLSSVVTKRNGNTLANVSFTYDSLKRLSGRSYLGITENYTYRNIDSTKATTQVSQISYPGSSLTLSYVYDTAGNITAINPTGWAGMRATYVYDTLGQLTGETINNVARTYTYDTYGNIRTATKGDVTHTYTYGDSQWRDLLTAYDGQAITYDEIGNPLSYYDGWRWTFTWSNGRQLSTADWNNTHMSFTYDLSGIRNSKTVNGTTYHYVTQNGQVVRQSWTKSGVSHVIDFVYDHNGRPFAMIYDGTTYYYMLNLQGDVIAITDENGSYITWYEYDAWGLPIRSVNETSVDLVTVNPLRYRGYYYDRESGFYYLQSRYYDPYTKRFINADTYASTGQGFLGYNMFSYCDSCPTSYIDSVGNRRIDALSMSQETPAQLRVSFAIQNKRLVDISDKLDSTMRSNAMKLAVYSKTNGLPKAALYFRDSVTDGGQWDIKLQDEWKFQRGYTYLYHSSILREDDTGNIHYGYVGTVLFSPVVLRAFAGWNQYHKYGTRFGNITTFYDDPRDQEMIKWGYELFWGDLIDGELW